jgi:hypothetical protein
MTSHIRLRLSDLSLETKKTPGMISELGGLLEKQLAEMCK